MSSRRFLLSEPPSEGRAALRGSEAHHLRNVCRAEPGRVVELMDGSGRVWRAVVDECSEGRVDLFKVELLESSVAVARLGVLQSLCKGKELEWLTEEFH